MYRTKELVQFAVAEFERGLVGLTDDEARVRQVKADGSQMNAISWIVAHVAWQWLGVRARATGGDRPAEVASFRFGSDDPTPPPLSTALEFLEMAKQGLASVDAADNELMAKVGAPGASITAAESVGTYLMRTVLHTWFHAGEVNAIRQMLGHPEIPFVGPMIGSLEWHPDPATATST
jgi:DinB superfamily